VTTTTFGVGIRNHISAFEHSKAVNACTSGLLNLTFNETSQSYITTDNQFDQSWCQALIWDPRPIFPSPWDFLLDSYCLLCCNAISDERTGLWFTVAAGPRQRSHLTRGQVCLLAVFRQYHSIMSHYLHKIFPLSVFDTVQGCIYNIYKASLSVQARYSRLCPSY
jgi:hypothetical protein